MSWGKASLPCIEECTREHHPGKIKLKVKYKHEIIFFESNESQWDEWKQRDYMVGSGFKIHSCPCPMYRGHNSLAALWSMAQN